MRKLRLSDKDILSLCPSILQACSCEMMGKQVVELSMYITPELEGESFYLSHENAELLYNWLDKFLMREQHAVIEEQFPF